MTAKEQAQEIYDQMKGFRVTNKHRKKCARVAVELIIKEVPYLSPDEVYLGDGCTTVEFFINERHEFWEKVLKELDEL